MIPKAETDVPSAQWTKNHTLLTLLPLHTKNSYKTCFVGKMLMLAAAAANLSLDL